MAWIEFHASDIIRLKKFHDLRKSCNWSSLECLGFLGRFWGLVIEVRENGDISDWNAEYLSEVMGLTDQVGKRAWDALGQFGWLETKDGSKLIVHDWLDYAGTFLRGKYSGDKTRHKLVEIWRFHGREYAAKKEPIGNLSVTDGEPIVPNRTLPYRTKPKEKEESGASPPRVKFVPPTPKEAEDYAKSIAFALDGSGFVDYYQARGWKTKGTKITDWKACIRTWKTRNKLTPNGKPKITVEEQKELNQKILEVQGLIPQGGEA